MGLGRFVIFPLLALAPLRAPAQTPLALDELLFDSNRSGHFEIYAMRLDGSNVRPLTGDVSRDSWWARLSPDRRQILFYRTPAGVHDTDYSQTALWMMDADGANLRLLRTVGAGGWTLQGHGEWSPDGTRLVMFGGPGAPQLYLTDLNGANPTPVTTGLPLALDPSWAPDGRTLYFAGCPATPCTAVDYEIYRVAAAGGAPTRLTINPLVDNDPYVSPDGMRIAWLEQTDASAWGGAGRWGDLVMPAGGGAVTTVIDDGQINSKPQWSTGGDEIFFHRLAPAPGARWSIYRTRPDGGGLAAIDPAAAGDNEFPSTGAGGIPVGLVLGKSAGDPQAPVLLWFGGGAPYRVFSGGPCVNAYANQRATLSATNWTDPAPPPLALTCYVVLAGAPAP